MAVQHVTETSYQALKSLRSSSEALLELASLLPDDDRVSALVRILADRIESDTIAIGVQVRELWQFAPRAPGEEEERGRAASDDEARGENA